MRGRISSITLVPESERSARSSCHSSMAKRITQENSEQYQVVMFKRRQGFEPYRSGPEDKLFDIAHVAIERLLHHSALLAFKPTTHRCWIVFGVVIVGAIVTPLPISAQQGVWPQDVAADRKLTHFRPLCRLKIDPGVLLALPKFWAGDEQGDHHGNVGKNQADVFARQGVAA